jgi:DnaK suppressor protein
MTKTHKSSEQAGEPTASGPRPEEAASTRPRKAAAEVTASTASAKKPAGAARAAGAAKAALQRSKAALHQPKAALHQPKPAVSKKAVVEHAVVEHARQPVAGRGAAHRATQLEDDDGEPIATFLAEQRVLLVEERAGYVRQADELKAEADSLALEHEPGDVQFDEEGGEGGTSNMDRELDLVLSAQARSAITEIDRALIKIEAGTYGTCEQCGRPIPKARLKALPYAALCVACKSGGLSRR